jgi:hypothetical protein
MKSVTEINNRETTISVSISRAIEAANPNTPIINPETEQNRENNILSAIIIVILLSLKF